MGQLSAELEQGSPDLGKLHVLSPGLSLSPATEVQHSFALALTATVREPLIVLDRDLRIVAASHSYRQMFKLGDAEGANPPFHQVNSPHWDSSIARLLRNVLEQNSVVENHEIQLDVPDIGKRDMLLNAHRVAHQRGHDIAMVVGLEDLTAKREVEDLRLALRKNQEMLLLEVHHRVANSLQIIASILLMKSRAVQSEEVRSHLHDVRHRLISVAMVQRQLSVSTPGNEVELGPYLNVLCEGLASSMIGDDQDVTIAASATNGTIKSEDAVSFGLIVTELVINSLKHGFPDGRNGRIVVAYVKDVAGWRLTVSDDGVGRSSDLAGHTPHVGLGTSIVEALAQSLKARIEIGPPGPGAMTAVIHAI